MKAVKSLLIFCVLSLFFVSCDFFDDSIKDYLDKYSSEIQIGDGINAVSAFHQDKYNNNHVPSNNIDTDGNERFIFTVPFANPADYHLELWDSTGNPVPAAEADITAIINNDESLIYFYIKNSYLKSLDKEQNGVSRLVSKTYTLIDPYYNKSADFTLSFNVNTRPDILDETNMTFGQIFESDKTKHILCFELKNPETYPELYSDLKDDDGFYSITINGEKHKFKWASNKFSFTETDKFFTTISDIVYPENNFSERANTFFFKMNDTVGSFNIMVEDKYGLQKEYKVSTQPSGKMKVVPPNVTAVDDCFTITPNFQTTGQIPQTLEQVIIEYKLNDEDYVSKTINATDTDKTITLYVSGGSWDLTCYAKSQNSQINDSQPTTKNLSPSKIVYVADTQADPDYKGAIADHPVTMANALKLLKTQTGKWTMMLTNDIEVSSVSGNAYINLSNSDETFELKITKSGTGTTHRKIDLKSKGRAIYAYGFPLTLEKIDITGGNLSSGAGAAICSNNKITLKNCNIYSNLCTGDNVNGGAIRTSGAIDINACEIYSNSITGASGQGGAIYTTSTVGVSNNSLIHKNTVTGNNSNGGAIYAEGNISLAYTNLYENEAKVSGGAIYCNKTSNQTVSLTNCSIYSNKANYGGAVYASNKLSVSNSLLFGNEAVNAGGAIYLIGASAYFDITSSVIGNKDSPNKTTGDSGKGGGIYLCSDIGSTLTSSTIGYAEADKIDGIDPSNISKEGGGLYCTSKSDTTNDFTVTLTNSSIIRNDASWGAGIYCNKNCKLTTSGNNSSKVAFNKSTTNGGGVYLKDSTISSSKFEVTGNKAGTGGGVYVSNTNAGLTANISFATISSNTATNGGGVSIVGTLELFGYNNSSFQNGEPTGPTISSNTATGYGGGVYCSSSGTTIKGCTITGNTGNKGGGLYTQNATSLYFTKISGNATSGTSPLGQGIYANDELTFASTVNISQNDPIYTNKAKGLHFGVSQYSELLPSATAKISIDCAWADKLQIAADNQQPRFMSNILLASTGYCLGPNYTVYEKAKHTPSTTKTFQQIINSLSSTATESNPGIIVFDDNYVENNDNFVSNTATNSSPAVFPAGTSTAKKKFIIYGNEKIYNVNSLSAKNKSAFYVNENVILEINDLTVTEAMANSSTDTNCNGGGLYIKGDVTLKNVNLGSPVEPTNANIWVNNGPTAKKGGGAYIANGGKLTFENGGIYKGYLTYNNCYGGGLYIEGGGEASLTSTKIYGCRVQDGRTGCEGAAIYCAKNGILRVNNIDIQKCKNLNGTPGIYFEDEAVFDEGLGLKILNNYTTSTAKIGVGIHCAGHLYIVTEASNFAQTFTNYNFSNTDENVDFFLPTGIKHYGGTDPSWTSVAGSTDIWSGFFNSDVGATCASTFVIGFKKSGTDYLKGTFVKGTRYGSLYYSSCSAFSAWE